MEQVTRAFGWLVPLFGLAAVALLLILCVLAIFRPDRTQPIQVFKHWMLGCWVLGVLMITIIPTGGYVDNQFNLPRPYSLIPFTEWFTPEGVSSRGILESLLNCGLFAAGGFLFKAFTKIGTLRIVVILSVFGMFIELFQFASHWMRAATATDLIMYASGAAIGACAYKLFVTHRPDTRTKRQIT